MLALVDIGVNVMWVAMEVIIKTVVWLRAELVDPLLFAV